MIKEIVDEINKAEHEAAVLLQRERENANEIIRKSRRKAEEIIGEINKKRKEIINLKVSEAETRANKESKKIEEETQFFVVRTEKEALQNMNEAVKMVFERVLRYGD